MKTFSIITLGCKVNQYESNAIQELFQKEGYSYLAFPCVADYYVVNTCTVTNMSDRKSRQAIRKTKKLNPDAILIVTGCLAQIKKEELFNISEIDYIVGNDRKNKIVDIIKEEKHDNIDDIFELNEFEDMFVSEIHSRSRAYVKIEDGCTNFCSYCIIPYARGKVRSRSLMSIKEEITQLASKGIKEVVFTGIHLSSYGSDLDNVSLIDAIKMANDIKGIKRVRLGSLEPAIITKSFLKEVASLNNFCPQFHLSLQSGCDKTLKKMNRNYSSTEYKNAVISIRKTFKDPQITTDVIVGFQGESNEDFLSSLEFVKNMKFLLVHVFKFSKREGTKAFTMEGDIKGNIKDERSKIMIETCKKNTEEILLSKIGKTYEVLIEHSLKNEENIYEGHTSNFIKVMVKSKDEIINKIISVKITNSNDEYLEGEYIE